MRLHIRISGVLAGRARNHDMWCTGTPIVSSKARFGPIYTTCESWLHGDRVTRLAECVFLHIRIDQRHSKHAMAMFPTPRFALGACRGGGVLNNTYRARPTQRASPVYRRTGPPAGPISRQYASGRSLRPGECHRRPGRSEQLFPYQAPNSFAGLEGPCPTRVLILVRGTGEQGALMPRPLFDADGLLPAGRGCGLLLLLLLTVFLLLSLPCSRCFTSRGRREGGEGEERE